MTTAGGAWKSRERRLKITLKRTDIAWKGPGKGLGSLVFLLSRPKEPLFEVKFHDMAALETSPIMPPGSQLLQVVENKRPSTSDSHENEGKISSQPRPSLFNCIDRYICYW